MFRAGPWWTRLPERRPHGHRNGNPRVLQALPESYGILSRGRNEAQRHGGDLTTREMRWEAEELLDRYVQCLDEDRLEEWPEFFTDNAVYRVVPRENADRGYALATMSCESKGMMIDRVVAIRNASVFSRRYLRHLVSGVRVTGQEGDCYLVHANYAVLQTTHGE